MSSYQCICNFQDCPIAHFQDWSLDLDLTNPIAAHGFPDEASIRSRQIKHKTTKIDLKKTHMMGQWSLVEREDVP